MMCLILCLDQINHAIPLHGVARGALHQALHRTAREGQRCPTFIASAPHSTETLCQSYNVQLHIQTK